MSWKNKLSVEHYSVKNWCSNFIGFGRVFMANIGPYLKGNKDKNNRKDKTITKKNVFCGLCSI